MNSPVQTRILSSLAAPSDACATGASLGIDQNFYAGPCIERITRGPSDSSCEGESWTGLQAGNLRETLNMTQPWYSHLVGYVAEVGKSEIDLTPRSNAYMALNPAQTLRDVTILSIDIVDSTALLERMEQEGASPLECIQSTFNPLRKYLESYDGRIMDVVGDAMIVVFQDKLSPWIAIGAALEIYNHRREEQS